MRKLKNKLFSLLLISMSSLSFAQMQYGVKGGVGYSNTTVVHGISDNRIGFLAGVVAKYQLRSNTEDQYIQAEVLYTNQGEYSVDKQDKKYNAFINYINIPIMYKFYFDDQGSDFFLEAGPQFGFKISDNIDPLGPEASNNKLKSFDMAINLGVGYALDRKYELNLRYGYGLTDTYDHVKWDNGTNRSSLFSLAFTYYFN